MLPNQTLPYGCAVHFFTPEECHASIRSLSADYYNARPSPEDELDEDTIDQLGADISCT